MTLLDSLRDAHEARLLDTMLSRCESFWALNEARLEALDPKPTALLEKVRAVLKRVRAGRIAGYPQTSPDDVKEFREKWNAGQEHKLELILLGDEQRLGEIGVT